MRLEKKFGKKKISLDELKGLYRIYDYIDLYKLVNNLINNNEMIPIKSSGGNGKNPALYLRYKVITTEENNTAILDEINMNLYNKFDVSYYKRNIKKYKEHRKYIIQLSDFLKTKIELLNIPISMNERSFQIWGREKFLQKEQGKTILKNLNIDLSFLNYYDTSEPLAYYSKSKKQPQNILILENKDTYYTMRQYLINIKEKILDTDISTVIYGGGKNIQKAFKDYNISVENYISSMENTIYYFGDLDYEGIAIYEGLLLNYGDKYKIEAFIKGYERMIDKAEKYNVQLPKTKEGQNRNTKGTFIKKFNDNYAGKIRSILNDGLYIPQEIINICDLMEEK